MPTGQRSDQLAFVVLTKAHSTGIIITGVWFGDSLAWVLGNWQLLDNVTRSW